jgi:phosphatidylglycerophosphatase A
MAMTESKRGSLQIRSSVDLVAVVIASGLGLGFIPFAPGTFGSLLGIAICYALIEALKFEPYLLLNAIIGASVVVTLAGHVGRQPVGSRHFKRRMRVQIVVDEVAGTAHLVCLSGAALARIGGNWRTALVIGFVLFRSSISSSRGRSEDSRGSGSGVGVMADDVLAGIYAAVVLSALLMVLPTLMLNAEIIAIGSELLTPYRVDTNSLWLTEQLNALGNRGQAQDGCW